jgi:RNAse (barnase) inhibitor barstar
MRDPFEYTPPAEPAPGALTLRLSAETDGRDALFDAYARALSFPDWFGRNWDALWDLLADLSWLDGRSVAIVHEGLPRLEPDALAVYVALLADAQVAWSEVPGSFRVLFAEADRDRVTALLTGRSAS